MPAIEAHGLSKTFLLAQREPGLWGSVKSLVAPKRKQVEAVKSVDLVVEEGEIVGFLGPNGAGKTTTIKMLTGILYPSGGVAKVLGYTPFDRRHEMLQQISLVMGNKMQLWWDLPAIDSFDVLQELYQIPRADYKQRLDRLVELLQIGDKLTTQVRKLSLGERMKCELVAAFLHQPKVIFLDEPTIGLDLVSQKRIRDFLRDVNREEGCTIILTSHYMQDVRELCERVVIIDHGQKMFDGTLSDLTNRFAENRRLRLTLSHSIDDVDLSRYGDVVDRADDHVVLSVETAKVAVVTADVLRDLPVVDIAIEDVSLDEIIRDVFAGNSADVSRETPDTP